jgi:hypothetical protein
MDQALGKPPISSSCWPNAASPCPGLRSSGSSARNPNGSRCRSSRRSATSSPAAPKTSSPSPRPTCGHARPEPSTPPTSWISTAPSARAGPHHRRWPLNSPKDSRRATPSAAGPARAAPSGEPAVAATPAKPGRAGREGKICGPCFTGDPHSRHLPRVREPPAAPRPMRTAETRSVLW